MSAGDRNAWVPKAVVIFITLVGLAIAAIGASFVFFGIAEWRMALASRDWTPVEGIVETSELHEHSVPSGSGSTSRQTYFDIAYRYEVDGVDRVGRRVAYTVTMGESQHRERAARYLPGAAVTVWVDPGDPTRAVLEPGGNGWNAVPIAMGLLAIAFPAGVVWLAWRIVRRFGLL